jgi:phosphatidylinositol alpha-1,6-mannosyltransferase
MNKPKVLLLTLHTFSLTGGIEKVSKILAKVLHDGIKTKQLNIENVKVLSLCDFYKDLDSRYCEPENFKGYGYNKSKFSLMAILNGLNSDIIILSHINLLTIAYFVKLFKKKTRIIMLAHGIEVWRNISPWKRYFFNKHIETWAVSEFTSNVLQEKHHIEKSKIKVLNNCLDPYLEVPATFKKPDYLMDRYGLKENQPVLMTISRLSSSELYKGYDLVIAAMPKLLEKYPNLVYVLGGKADEGEKTRLTKLIATNNLQQHIRMANYIADKELIHHFLLADVFVMPSKKEGFGIVFIEAAACGCPVIAGNQDGSTDALLNGQLGILINPESTGELITAIDKVITQSKSEELSVALQQQCLSHFSYERYKQKVVGLLQRP